MTRHIHADLMLQAANDTTIQWDWTYPTEADSGNWFDIPGTPFWEPSLIYRQRPIPHSHQALIDQAKADPSIKWQWKPDVTDDYQGWQDCGNTPSFYKDNEYRQKPAELVMVDMWLWAYRHSLGGIFHGGRFMDEIEASMIFGNELVCRIEGSKISVEVSL